MGYHQVGHEGLGDGCPVGRPGQPGLSQSQGPAAVRFWVQAGNVIVFDPRDQLQDPVEPRGAYFVPGN